jgi:hypothetical protein
MSGSSQNILLTALPNGIFTESQGTPHIQLSIFISPRLVPSAGNRTLSPDFPDFQDWPATLNGMRFFVQFENAKLLPASVITKPKANSNTWKDLFPYSTTYVKPYQYNSNSNLNILSFQARGIVEFIMDQYLAAAKLAVQAPQDFPSISSLVANGFGKIAAPFPVDLQQPAAGIGEGQVISEIESLLSPSRNERLGYRGSISTNDYSSLSYADQLNFEQAKIFFDPYSPAFKGTQFGLSLVKFPQTPVQIPNLDFHKMLSTCSQYPNLMRALGLVVDLDVPVNPSDLAKIPHSGRVWIIARAKNNSSVLNVLKSPGKQTPIAPKTRYTLSPHNIQNGSKTLAFAAEPRGGSDLGNDLGNTNLGNMLLFNNGRFDFVQVDVNSAAIKALDFANNLIRRLYGMSPISHAPYSTADTPNALSLPHLKTTGLSLIRADRASRLANILFNAQNVNTALTTGQDTTLYADDLIRGYRPDIWDGQTNGWYSLCMRDGTYLLNNANIPDIPAPMTDEGWISLGVTQAPNPNNDPENPIDPNNPDMRLHESIFTWAGWSLVAPRPKNVGAVLNQPDQNNDWTHKYDAQQALADSNNQWASRSPPVNQWNLAVSFDANSLPRFRLGNTYRLRLRAVDQAGNSLDLNNDPNNPINDVGSSHPWLSDPIILSRFEPVQSPILLLVDQLNPPGTFQGNPSANPPNPPNHPTPSAQRESPGESLDRFAIRSNYKPQDDATTYNTKLTNRFNLNFGWIFEPESSRLVGPPRTGEVQAELHGVLDDSQHLFNPDSVMKYGDIVAADKYNYDTYTDADDLQFSVTEDDPNNRTVPYLPDPISRGAALLFLDADGNKLKLNGLDNPLKVPFYPAGSKWPKQDLFLLKLTDGGSASQPSYFFVFGGNELDIALPKGQTVKVRISSYIDPGDIPSMGILQWVANSLSPKEISSLVDMSTNGQFWMVTPYRDVTLVHAVQQPTMAPSFNSLTQAATKTIPPIPLRRPGNTFAVLEGVIGFDGQSTARLDVLAAWQDVFDDPAFPLPNDGKLYDDLKIAGPPLNRTAHVFEVSKLDPMWTDVEFSRFSNMPGQFPSPPQQKQEFGDTRFREVRYTIAATTRYSEYLPLHTKNNDGIQDTSTQHYGISDEIVRYGQDDIDSFADFTKPWPTEWTLRIPSSARPDKPKILYVVPTFRWLHFHGSRKARSLHSRKFGGGLRVYMDRPWYSSGDGELLGVVIWIPPAGHQLDLVPPDNLAPLVTNWGMDPLWISGIVNRVKINNFRNMSSNAAPATVHLAETGNPVIVAPYDVLFDPERRLWYADIQFESVSGYFPFIRLALARYQPNSLFGVELSPVVLADYAQITPSRDLSVVELPPVPPSTLPRLQIVLQALGYVSVPQQSSLQSKSPNQVQVLLQTQDPTVPDPDTQGNANPLGWQLVPNASIWLTPNTVPPISSFSGIMTLPAARGSQNFRLIIAEYEQYTTDLGVGGPVGAPRQLNQPPGGGPFADYDPLLQPNPGYRLVYAETVLI